MDEQAIIQVSTVSKQYGMNKAIKQVSFQVKRGELHAIIGKNGAGKTTLLELLMGHRTVDAGAVTILGTDISIDAKTLRGSISIFMQNTTLVDKMTVKEALEMLQGFYNLRGHSKELLKQFELEPYEDKFVKRLSGGLRQRAMLAIAIANNPEVVILDEPTTGLDMQAKEEYWAYLQRLREQGKTIVITSHDMPQIQRYCDCVTVLKEGSIAASGRPDDLIAELPGGGLTMEAVYMHYAVNARGGVGV